MSAAVTEKEKNRAIAENVLNAVGGKDNIAGVTHCMTRLRFNLKDDTIPNSAEIKKIKGVLGTAVSGGQYQVIIGQNVPKVYTELCSLTGLEEKAAIDENLDEPAKSSKQFSLKSVGNSIMAYLSGSMAPLIPVMVAAAMFKTVQVLLGPNMLNLMAADSDAFMVMDFLYDSFYYFLPVFLGASAAKKMGINQYLGMFLGAMLIAPDFVALIGTKETISIYGLFSAPVNKYGQSVLPILLTVAVAAPVYRFFKKHIPDVLTTLFTPFFTALVMVPIAFCLLAPFGRIAGDWLGNLLIAFGEHGGFFAIALIAGLWEFIVISGMHTVLAMFSVTTMLTLGVESCVAPAASVATFAAYGIALGGFLRLRNKEEKALALGYFVSGFLGGVTEPTLYGLGFKYKRTLIALFCGGFLGGLYAGITHVAVYAKGPANFLGVIGYIAGGTPNTVNGIVSCIIGMAAAAIITYFFGFTKDDLKD